MNPESGLSVSAQNSFPEPVREALAYAQQLEAAQDCHAILLFGSYAQGTQRPGSDVDVLIISTSEINHIYHNWAEVSVDIVFETQESIRKKLDIRDQWNNNFMLNLLNDAVIVKDSGGIATSLSKEARRRRLAGPPLISRNYAAQARRALQLMLRSAKTNGEHTYPLSRERQVLSRMRLDQVVNRSFYLVFKAKGRWTSSFPRLVTQIQAEEPELYSLWLAYIDSAPSDAPRVVARIVDYCLVYLARCEDPIVPTTS